MGTIHITGQTIVEHDEAEQHTRNYTPSVQEQTDEVADDAPDKTPISETRRQELDAAQQSTFQSPFPQDGDQHERADAFQIPGEWVSPVVKARRKKAMILPSAQQTNDLQNRIAAVVRFDGAPAEVTRAATKAREAVAEAIDVHRASAHPENRRYARDVAAKDATVTAIAKATRAVSALEALARDEAVREKWFAGLVDNIQALQAKAAKDGEAFAKSYAQWRQTIAAADALAREQDRFQDWHRHPDERAINPLGLIGEIRRARDLAKTDDVYLSGQYLAEDPTPEGEVPEWTMAALKGSADRAPGSFAESVYFRLKSVHSEDHPAKDSISMRDLRIINSQPIPALTQSQREWEAHARSVDPTV